MEEIVINTWSDFEEQIQGLLRQQREDLIGMMNLPHLFRGQSDSAWRLETSMERIFGEHLSFETYHSMILGILPEIKTFNSREWDLPTTQELLSQLTGRKYFPFYAPELATLYDYMGYLRHYGFPSPLLDWTNSPYIAAYFAFRELSSTAKQVAIYAYTQDPNADNRNPEIPIIFPIWSQTKSNKRHYLQQSTYTICTKFANGKYCYASHEEVLSKKEEGGEWLTKYILPASERGNALMSLETYNINAYSLFGTEESLLETLFIRGYAVQKARKVEYPGWEGSRWY